MACSSDRDDVRRRMPVPSGFAYPHIINDMLTASQLIDFDFGCHD
jgi:hypothetical protein